MADEEPQRPAPEIRAVPLDEVRRARGEAKVAMPRSKVASLRAFRRIRADRTLGAIGVLLILVGFALIFAWEKPPPVEPKYGVEWPNAVTEFQTIQGQALDEGASRPHEFTLDAVNMTAVTIQLLWSDTIGNTAFEEDRLQLEIQGPEGTNISSKANTTGGRDPDGGNISHTIPLSGIPNIAAVPASTDAEALAAVGDQTNRTGIGQWTVTVTVLDTRGDIGDGFGADERVCPSPQAPPTPACTPDPNQDYTVRITYSTYSMQLEKIS